MKSHHVLIASGTALAGGAGLWYLLYGLPAYRQQLRAPHLIGYHETPHSPVAGTVIAVLVGAFLILLGVILMAGAYVQAAATKLALQRSALAAPAGTHPRTG